MSHSVPLRKPWKGLPEDTEQAELVKLHWELNLGLPH